MTSEQFFGIALTFSIGYSFFGPEVQRGSAIAISLILGVILYAITSKKPQKSKSSNSKKKQSKSNGFRTKFQNINHFHGPVDFNQYFGNDKKR